MKKFFSLVLALVMALSLTTVAWGADLSADVEADFSDSADYVTYNYNNTATPGSDKAFRVLPAAGSFDGNNKTVTFTNANGGKDAGFVLLGNANIENVKIVGVTRGIESGYEVAATSITIDNVVIEDCVRTIHINTVAAADLYVSNSTFEGKISFDLQGGTATFTNCTFKFDSVLDTGKGNIMDFYDSVVFENCVFEEGYMVNVYDLHNSGTAGATVEMVDCIYAGEPVTADNVDDLVVNIKDYNESTEVVSTVPAGVVTPPTYTATGTTAVDTKDAKTMAVKGAMVIEMVPAKAAYVNAAGNWVSGYVKHYVDEYGDTYVPCTADVEGALYLYYKGTSSVYDIVVAANPYYDAVATEFTNFGIGCDQLDNRANTAAKYYSVVDGNGVKYLLQGTTTSATQLMVDGKLVPVINANVINQLNDHKWIVTKNAKNEITAAKCSLCGQPASWTLNMAAIPVGAEFEAAPGGGYLYWNAAPSAPSTDKVTSAETFDAGIALYVGMSVMAAAGSAVVIGKKKD